MSASYESHDSESNCKRACSGRLCLSPGFELNIYTLHADNTESQLAVGAESDTHTQARTTLQQHQEVRIVLEETGSDTSLRVASPNGF